jgi:uncharacterized membrane protein
MEQSKRLPWLHNLPFRWFIVAVVFLVVVIWGLNTPEGLLGKADAIGYAVCHRIDLRSFHLGERVLPLCARCSGMYLGVIVGLVYQAITGRRRTGLPPLPVIIVLLVFVGAFGVDGGNSYLALIFGDGLLYTPTNTLRLFTGTGMGLVIVSALFPAFNQTVWRDWIDQPAIQSFSSFAVMVFAAVFVDILLLLEIPKLLYILALLSAAGVLVVLTMLYSMIFLMVTRKENEFVNFVQLSFALVVGFGVGLMQIGFIDLIRFWLTGTWDGFHFG